MRSLQHVVVCRKNQIQGAKFPNLGLANGKERKKLIGVCIFEIEVRKFKLILPKNIPVRKMIVVRNIQCTFKT